MARCIETVKARPGWGGGRNPCHNPGEFTVRLSSYDDRPVLSVCRTHLPVLIKRLMLQPQRAKQPVTVGLVILEEESGG